MSHADASTGSVPRVAPVEQPTEEQQELLAKTMSRKGRPLLLFRTLAHHPRLLKRFNAMGGLFMTGELDPRERELVILRVAARTGSEYEYAQHVLIGRKTGLSDEEISAVARPGLDGWPEEDRLLLRLADELLDHDVASDEVYRLLEERYTTQQLLELLLLPGFYRMLAGALRTLRLEPEDDLPSSPSLAEARG